MSKIICDICGTSYQDTAECCPICGCTRDSAADILTDEAMIGAAAEVAADPADRKKQIFDYDEANAQRKAEPEEDDEDEDFDEEEDEDDRPRRNVFVVILLTVLIVALLLAGGFLVVRYILPNMGDKAETTPVATETQQLQTEVPTTEANIACETLVLKSASQADLTEEGFSHLINVLVIPEDTTDALTFESADQSVATVSEDGKITAVGEGETIVTITCGNVQAFVNVVCDFTPETEATEEATEATEEATEAEGETTGETVAETEGNKEIDPTIQLKLVKNDIRLGVYYSFTLELDCSLDAKDVEWSSEHPHIATVNEEGVVTAVQAGTTAIIAKYGDQQVQCMIRCF